MFYLLLLAIPFSQASAKPAAPTGAPIEVRGPTAQLVDYQGIAAVTPAQIFVPQDAGGVAAISPDGKLVATINGKGTAKLVLWSRDGRIVRAFPNTSESISEVAFSPDGTRIAVAERIHIPDRNAKLELEEDTVVPNGTVNIYGIDGTLHLTLEGSAGDTGAREFSSVAYSVDGRYVAATWVPRCLHPNCYGLEREAGARTVQVWEADGKPVSTTDDGAVRVAFGAGNEVLSTDLYGEPGVRVRSVDGTLLRTLRKSKPVYTWAVSADGSAVATCDYEPEREDWENRVYSPRSKNVRIMSLLGDVHATLKLGKMRDEKGPMLGELSLGLSGDGALLAVSLSSFWTGIWTRDGELTRRFDERANEVVFFPNEAALAVGDFFIPIEAPERALQLPKTSGVTDVVFLDDGSLMVASESGQTGGGASFHIGLDGELLDSLPAAEMLVQGATGEIALFGAAVDDGELKIPVPLLYDADGTLRGPAPFKDEEARAGTLVGARTPQMVWGVEGEYLLEGTTAYDRQGDSVGQIHVPPKELDVPSGRYSILAVSPDGQWIVGGAKAEYGKGDKPNRYSDAFPRYGDDTWNYLHLIRAGTTDSEGFGTREAFFGGHYSPMKALTFSPDGQSIYSGGREGDVRQWSLDGELLQRYSWGASRHFLRNHTGAITFLVDGTMVSGHNDGHVRMWHADGSLARSLPAETEEGFGKVNRLALAPNGRLLVASYSDGQLRFWNLDTGEFAAYYTRDGEWILYMQDGTFDSSRRGASLVSMTRGATIYSVDQLALRHNRPDRILERIGHSDDELIQFFEGLHKRRVRKAGLDSDALVLEANLPEVSLEKVAPADGAVTLTLECSDQQLDLVRANIYVNDVSLPGSRPLEGREASYSETVELIPGENRIEVSCTNVSGQESFRVTTVHEYAVPHTPDLWFVGFGVSDYADSRLDLAYAAKDVNDLGATMGNLEGKAFDGGNIATVHVHTWTDEDVTVQTIRDAKAVLAAAQPDDIVIVFIAGHGVYERGEQATYYYLTHGADTAHLAETAADFSELEDLLYDIAPRTKLFLMDTCESGELEVDARTSLFAAADSQGISARTTRGLVVVQKEGTSRPEARRFLRQRDRFIFHDLLRRSGAVVFSSSRGGEFSYESDAIENGFFTNEIIAALGDGSQQQISLRDLRTRVSERVAEATENKQHPTVDRDNAYLRLVFPVSPEVD